MHIKKIIHIPFLFLICISCKNKNIITNTEINIAKEKTSKTYAEISIKQDGHWEGREYIDGIFKNTDSIHLPKEHTDHSWFIRYEGPGWENSKIGYRIYLDWRNAIDIFGKKVDSLILPYVGQDGFDSYHENADWGQDILKAGKSMGIGGYGRILADTIIHFKNVKNTFVNIENSKNASSINITYENWTSGEESINLNSKLTIYPTDRFTQAELTPSVQISGLTTGVPIAKNIPLFKNEGEKWAYIATYGKQTLVSPPDNLGMALFYKLNDIVEQKKGKHDHLVIFKPTVKTITYYFLGAWEQEPNGIKTEKSFLEDINFKLQTLEEKNLII